jgi:hypothetical protein
MNVPACWYCGGCVAERDHKMPRSRGGTNDPDNIAPACWTCNSTKSARTVEEFRIRVASVNAMKPDQVRFHGEGGRTFSRVRIRSPGQIEPPNELRDRVRALIGTVGVKIGAQSLHISTESIALIANDDLAPQIAVELAQSRIEEAERYATMFRVGMDEILSTLDGIGRSLEIVNSIERFREVVSRLAETDQFTKGLSVSRSFIARYPDKREYEKALRRLVDALDNTVAAQNGDSIIDQIETRREYGISLENARKVLAPEVHS